MPVRTRALGARLDSVPVEVTVRRLLAFAAGIGATDSRTFDDAAGVVAVPSFCAALEWPAISGSRREDLLGLTAAEARRAVHVEQDSQFHRAIRPGDLLHTRATITRIRPTRAGAFVGMRLATVDARDESPVTTTWYGAIYRGVGVEGDGGSTEEPPVWPTATESLDRRADVAVAREAGHVYTECSGIWNPIHTERAAALAAGLPDIILHGTATWALAGRELVRAYCGGDPERLLRLRARFAAPVVPGGAIAVLHGAVSPGRVHFVVQTSAGEAAIADGRALVAAEGR